MGIKYAPWLLIETSSCLVDGSGICETQFANKSC